MATILKKQTKIIGINPKASFGNFSAASCWEFNP
jgi:hypothetical protein